MSTISFNDGIYTQQVLDAFLEYITPVKSFARDFSSETAKKGNAVYVPRIDGLTATTGDGYENASGAVGTITVNLDKRQVSTVDISDIQAANSSAAKVENFARQQACAIATKFLTDVWSLLTTTNFGNAVVTTAAANWTKTQIRAIRKALNEAKAPMSNRSMVLDSDIVDALLGDSTLSTLIAYTSNESLQTGKLPALMGFQNYESNLVPLNSASIMGFGCHPDSIAIASRYLESQAPGEYLAAMPVVDSESGLTLGYRRHFNPGSGKHYASFEILYGYAVGLSTGLKLITVP